MTREEAINKLVNARYADEFQGDEELTTAHLMAIQALEQEPCIDAVSRQAVLDSFWKLEIELRPSAIDTIVEMVKQLPSVRPQKSGKWLPTYGNVQCSVCGGVQDGRNVGKATLYCCYCGARMVEPQERSDKE